MTERSSAARLAVPAAVLVLLAGVAGFGLARLQPPRPAPPAVAVPSAPKPLYWYDPMVPGQHFDKPGKSPFMDMQLVARYPEAAPAPAGGAMAAGVRIDPAAAQNLGLRLATVERGVFGETIDATGVIEFNQRQLAVVQARAPGFVQRVYGHAPGDVIGAGAPIADILVPSWGGAEAEYLAVRRTGDAVLAEAARQRLRLLGIPDGVIAAVAKDGRSRSVITVSSPIGGAIQTLDVRQGMTVNMGQTLAQVSGLGTVWLNASVPEAESGRLRTGSLARAELAAFPGETLAGRISAILPNAQTESRTTTLRIELANPGGRLRPGMFATVHLSGAGRSALFVPSEAVIRTGARVLVMVAQAGGRYQPVEVGIGADSGGRTEVLAGLVEGQKVVASGQFLIDSEADLGGIKTTPLAAEPMTPAGARR